MIGTNGERDSGKSALAARLDDNPCQNRQIYTFTKLIWTEIWDIELSNNGRLAHFAVHLTTSETQED